MGNYSEMLSAYKDIEKNLIGKEFPDQMIFDASFHVTINYNNQKIEIHNYTEIYSDLYKIIEKK